LYRPSPSQSIFQPDEKKYDSAQNITAKTLTFVPKTMEYRRYHLHEHHVEIAPTARFSKVFFASPRILLRNLGLRYAWDVMKGAAPEIAEPTPFCFIP
jgi:hypothetical protein